MLVSPIFLKRLSYLSYYVNGIAVLLSLLGPNTGNQSKVKKEVFSKKD